MVALFLLSGCAAVGPDYVPPETAVSGEWHTQLKGGLTEEVLNPKTLATWWTTLNDPLLSELVDQAVLGNLDLKQAEARVREARARRGLTGSDLYPSFDTSGSVTRKRRSESTYDGKTMTLYVAGFDAGWEVDIFGGVRRSIEAAQADLEASRESLHDVLVTLTAEVGLNYVEVRIFQARLSVAEANLHFQQDTYDLIRSRYEAGLSNELTVQQARYNLESTRSQIPALRTGLEGAKNRLAVLLGRPPGALHDLLAERRPIPVIPPTVAVGVPAETLRRRPDIRKAERDLAAQTARIGESTAELYPKFRLAGTIGLESIGADELLRSGSRYWSLGPSISWNIFDAGAVRKNIEIQNAKQEQYLIAYEAAVLNALEEVENSLAAYAEEQLRRERLAAAVEAAQKAVSLAQDQYKAGLVDFSSVLDAQRSLLSFQDQMAQSEGKGTRNLISLYKALGGGWSALTSN